MIYNIDMMYITNTNNKGHKMKRIKTVTIWYDKEKELYWIPSRNGKFEINKGMGWWSTKHGAYAECYKRFGHRVEILTTTEKP
jgi:hypothetical protein